MSYMCNIHKLIVHVCDVSHSDKGEYSFKPSKERKNPDLMFVPTNLHIQRLRVRESSDPGEGGRLLADEREITATIH